MLCVHTTRGPKRYRYYLSQRSIRHKGEALGSLPRIAAGVLEDYLVGALESRLSPSWLPDAGPRQRVKLAISRLALGADQVAAHIYADAASEETRRSGNQSASNLVEVRLPIVLKRREGAAIIVPHDDDTQPVSRLDKTLIRAVVLARGWAADIADNKFGSIKELARYHGLCPNHTMRLLPLAYLAPDLVAMILEGRQPQTLSLKTLTAEPLPLDWVDQRARVALIGRGLFG